MTCFQYEGVNAIKRALLKGVALGSEEVRGDMGRNRSGEIWGEMTALGSEEVPN